MLFFFFTRCQVDDVIELLESMSKTQALEKTMSMIDFAPSSSTSEAQRRSQQAAGGDGGAGFGPNLDVPTVHLGYGAPNSGVGAAVGRGGMAVGAGLGPIAELTNNTNLGGSGHGGGGGEVAFGRSMSVPAMPTMKRPSSMMLTEYFTSIAEESARGGDKKDEEGDEGVWF